MTSGRLGLMGIHERARLFGGRAAIDSEPGVGTGGGGDPAIGQATAVAGANGNEAKCG